MDKIMQNKRGLELVTSLSSGYKNSFIRWCITWPVFELFQKLNLLIYAS